MASVRNGFTMLAGLTLWGCSSSSDPSTQAAHCGPLPTDSHASERQSCSFEAGALAEQTLGVTEAARQKLPLEHIVVVMKENRSYDHLLGKLAERGQADSEAIPAGFSNPDTTGAAVTPFHQTNTCFVADPGHQWDEMHAQVDDGKMDGFVTSAANTTQEAVGQDGHFVMGYYDQADLPFYYFLANTFAIGDRHFASVRGGTWPNRDYLLCGTSDGVTVTAGGIPNVPCIMDSLDRNGVSWGTYTDDFLAWEIALGGAWTQDHPGVYTFQDFVDQMAAGTLPEVAFVDAKMNIEDEHPPADVQGGEVWTKRAYDAVVKSPLWNKTAMIFVYDEAGGFFDHVPPGNTCVARPQDSQFYELGVRVPLFLISPWAKRHYVSHVMHEHTSITRLIETVFGIPAMTARDANSDALLDMFDFSCTTPAAIPEAPAAGTGGCQ